MGCTVTVAGATVDELAAVRSVFFERDRVFSRFRPGSELNRVNACSGRIVRVSPLFSRVLSTALRAAAQSDGLVDPTLGHAIEAAGYDRDFSQLVPVAAPAISGRPGVWRSVRTGDGVVWVPEGVRLDLNGVAKACAVDDALALIDGDGYVCAGGDLSARGPLDVSLPGGDAIRLVAGALATSGSMRRQWLRAGHIQHHLIDPHTGCPARSCWEQVTVAGAHCLAADIAAKAAFLLSEEGPGWLDQHGIPARFITHDHVVTVNRAWRKGLREAACI
ncbi:MAG: FAD:protein FMN transferase [Gaiellales bacterium]